MISRVDCLVDLFWDVNISLLDKNQDQQFIIERILKYGRLETIQWLLANYSDKEIIAAIKCSKTIDKKTAHYWAIHYHIPKEEVLCLNRSFLQKRFY